MLQWMFQFSRLCVRGLIAVSGAALIAVAIVITADILLRKTIGFSIPATDELAGYVFAISTAVAFSFALLENANVRVDVLYDRAKPRVRRLIDFLGFAALGLFVLLLTWRASLLLYDSYLYDSRSISPLNTALVYPQAIWVAALCLYGFNLVLMILIALRALLLGAPMPGKFDSDAASRDLIEVETAPAANGRPVEPAT